MTASRKALIVLTAFIALWLGLPMSGAVSTASAQTIKVDDADPSTAPQGTLGLDVKITGSGFQRKGTTAKFYVHGTTNPGGIKVNSTRYIDTTTLIANIDIAPDAVVDLKFDIEVLSGGRTGKGTDLFTVLKKIDPCVVPDPTPVRTAFTSDAAGNPGWLDGRFGAGTGQVVSLRSFYGSRAAVQVVDGEPRIVKAGELNDRYCTNDGQSAQRWVVVRYKSNGELDNSFGNGDGVITTAFAGGSAFARDLAIDRDNKIVVVGGASLKRGANSVPAAVRYNVDGSVDESFANAGVAAIPFGRDTGSFDRDTGYATAVAMQADNKIVMVATVSSAPHMAVIRLTANGSLDTTFHATGKFVDDSNPDRPVSMGAHVTSQWVATQAGPEERIVVAGTFSETTYNTRWVGALWRFTASGALDADFGSGGLATTVNPFGDTYLDTAGHGDVTVDAENRLVVTVGFSTSQPAPAPARYEAALVRFLAAGTPDTTFGGGGMVLLPSPASHSSAGAVAIRGDGRVVVVGTTYPDAGSSIGEPAAWRLTAEGLLDPSFGNGGWISHAVMTEAFSFGDLVQGPDGTIVASGMAWFWLGEVLIPYGFLARLWQ